MSLNSTAVLAFESFLFTFWILLNLCFVASGNDHSVSDTFIEKKIKSYISTRFDCILDNHFQDVLKRTKI